MDYKFTSCKEYKEIGPVAYRQWRADSHCSKIHGYAMSFKFHFGSAELDARNWVVDFGGLQPLKEYIESMFDHTLLVASDDPLYKELQHLHTLGLATVREVSATGCESIADMLYKYVNGHLLPSFGMSDSVWCFKVEVRETGANSAYRTGHRNDNEDLSTDHRGIPF